jgi:hypothetical protein
MGEHGPGSKVAIDPLDALRQAGIDKSASGPISPLWSGRFALSSTPQAGAHRLLEFEISTNSLLGDRAAVKRAERSRGANH